MTLTIYLITQTQIYILISYHIITFLITKEDISLDISLRLFHVNSCLLFFYSDSNSFLLGERFAFSLQLQEFLFLFLIIRADNCVLYYYHIFFIIFTCVRRLYRYYVMPVMFDFIFFSTYDVAFLCVSFWIFHLFDLYYYYDTDKDLEKIEKRMSFLLTLLYM